MMRLGLENASDFSHGFPGGGDSNIFGIFTRYLGRWSNLTSIFFQKGWYHQIDPNSFYMLFGGEGYDNIFPFLYVSCQPWWSSQIARKSIFSWRTFQQGHPRSLNGPIANMSWWKRDASWKLRQTCWSRPSWHGVFLYKKVGSGGFSGGKMFATKIGGNGCNLIQFN